MNKLDKAIQDLHLLAKEFEQRQLDKNEKELAQLKQIKEQLKQLHKEQKNGTN